MRILIVSTLKRKVSPDNFASRSRIIYQLSQGLSKKGHSVSLLGTGDSQIPGVEIIPVTEKGWVDLPKPENEFLRDTASLVKQNAMILDQEESFDVIHSHTYPDFFPTIAAEKLTKPLVITLHALYADYMDDILARFNKANLIALSERYKKLYKKASIYDVVYNGVDTNLYSFEEKKDDYLLWIGRLARGKKDDGSYIDQKGVGWAIKLAQQSDSRLKMAGPCEDIEFFEKEVKPHLNDKIEWVGEVSAEQSLPVEQVVQLMQDAKAFLMTINQEEPFGLVMAEAMSCGTPVIGFDRGAVSEVILEGKTGFVVDPNEGVGGLIQAISKIGNIKPIDCRNHVLEKFSIDKMVDNYERIYQELIKK